MFHLDTENQQHNLALGYQLFSKLMGDILIECPTKAL